MEQNEEIKELSQEIQPDFCFKVVMFGSPGVGKTCITKYEEFNNFFEEYKPTVVFEHSWKNYSINEKAVRLQIWDICGNESYNAFLQNYLNKALCVFIVFSLDNELSYQNVDKWVDEIKYGDGETPIIFLVGNKCDMSDKRKVPIEEINEFCKKNNIDGYFETSAKTGEGIHEMFKSAVKQLFIRFIEPINFENQSRGVVNGCSTRMISESRNGCQKCLCNIQ